MASPNPFSLLPTLEADLARVEDALLNACTSDLEMLGDAASHLARAGGKRVRPGFAIASAATAFGEPAAVHQDVIMGAVATELVHLGSLYHDDVMDEASTRRSVEAANQRWGNVVAILTGDFLLAQVSLISAALGVEVTALMGETIAALTDGQIRELSDTNNLQRTQDNYLAAIAGKTASLLACACKVGAICSGFDADTTTALTDFGFAYGMGFQIVDDILDLTATSEQLGKPAGNDILEGNYTLPVLFALNSDVGPRITELCEAGLDLQTRDEAIALVRSTDAVQESLSVARHWADKASANLTELAPTAGANVLRAAAQDLIARAH